MSIPELSDRPRLVLIAGPTASGKSAMALELAEREDGVVVNADASQVYADLRILTARPSADDEARVPHRLYGYRAAARPCSAADWAADARAEIAAIISDGKLPILVGGTGLYLRTLLDGIAPIPPIDPGIRACVRAMSGPAAHAALQREDLPAAVLLHPNDTTRSQRALETIRSTGRSILDWRALRGDGIGGDYRLEMRRIDPPIADLIQSCDRRVDRMLAGGAIDEVAALARRALDGRCPAMRALGVQQIIAFINREVSFDKTRQAICVATRQYAKRQRTWFRNQTFDFEARSTSEQKDS